jgi:hypothetical protein
MPEPLLRRALANWRPGWSGWLVLGNYVLWRIGVALHHTRFQAIAPEFCEVTYAAAFCLAGLALAVLLVRRVRFGDWHPFGVLAAVATVALIFVEEQNSTYH